MNKIKLFVSGFRKGFTDYGLFMADSVNYILLSFVYFFGVGFTAILARVSGKHFLQLRKSAKKTCWLDNKISRSEIDQYYRQF